MHEKATDRKRGQIQLGQVRGIPIRGHWSLPVLAVTVAVALGQVFLPAAAAGHAAIVYWMAALFAGVAVVASILIHELGHAVVAQRRGLKVHGIMLWALGGVVHLTRSPSRPQDEAAIGLAGPAVGLLTAAACWVLATIFSTIGVVTPMTITLSWLAEMGLVLSILNLVPAAPLDGGRLLRAACWRVTGRRNSGHMAAAHLGRVLGTAVCLLGVWRLLSGGEHGLALALLGWLLLSAATTEAHSSDMEIALGETVADDVVAPFGAAARLEQPPRSVLDSSDPLRLPPGHLVYDDDGEMAGLLLGRRLLRACNDGTSTIATVVVPMSELLIVDPDAPVLDVMAEMDCYQKQRAIVMDGDRPIGFFGVPELRLEVRRKLHTCAVGKTGTEAAAASQPLRRPDRLVSRVVAAVATLAVLVLSLGLRDGGNEVVCDCQYATPEVTVAIESPPESPTLE